MQKVAALFTREDLFKNPVLGSFQDIVKLFYSVWFTLKFLIIAV